MKCKECGAELKWVLTPTGKKMPLEAKEKIFYQVNDEGEITYCKGYEPHWGNCPGADRFRKK